MTQKPYTIYDLETGEAIQTGYTPEKQLDAMRTCVEDGQGFIEKTVNHKTHRVSTDGRVIRRRKSDINRENNREHVRSMKAQRNHLLAQSDWTQMPDANVDQSAWKEYRQALRDLPKNTDDPSNPNWPEPPKT